MKGKSIVVGVAAMMLLATSVIGQREEVEEWVEKGKQFLIVLGSEDEQLTVGETLKTGLEKKGLEVTLIKMKKGESQEELANKIVQAVDDEVEQLGGVIGIETDSEVDEVKVGLVPEPFRRIEVQHLRSPEYDVKMGPYAGMLASCLKDSLESVGSSRVSICLAPRINGYLPLPIRRRMLGIVTKPGEMKELVPGIIQGIEKYQQDRGYSMVGIIPHEVTEKAGDGALDIKLFHHVYDNEPPDYKASDEQKKQRREQLQPQFLRMVVNKGGDCFVFSGLERLTPYHFEICQQGATEAIAEGDFVTGSLGGVMRTIPNEIGDFAKKFEVVGELKKEKQQSSEVKELVFDYVITGATIIDGSGEGRIEGKDIGVVDGEIGKIGDLSHSQRHETIEAKGCFLVPGFIDIHNHSDRTILSDPAWETYLAQGVTTLLAGNCSFSPLGIGGHLLRIEKELEQKRKLGVNYAILIGNRPVRKQVIGQADRMATYDELYRMKELVDLGVEEGAFGLSTGLIYSIGENAHTWELVSLAKQLKPYEAFYASHVRGETDELLDAAREAIFIGELGDVPVQISHIKSIAKRNWGNLPKLLDHAEQARAQGVDVLCDQYPYRGTGGSYHYKLHRAITLRAIKEGNPDTVMFKRMPEEYKHWEGRLLSEVMKEEGKTEQEIMELLPLAPDTQLYAMYVCLSDEDLQAGIEHELVMVASDSSIATRKHIAKGDFYDDHPRTYGTFAEFFGTYVRERGWCSWEKGVYKCTRLPAQRMRLKDRGLIAEGMKADIAIFDPQKFTAKNDFLHPGRAPEGMRYVFLNGQLAYKDGELMEQLGGEVLRLQGCTYE